MVVLDLKTGDVTDRKLKINRSNSKIPKTQKQTGIKFNWIYDLKELDKNTLGKPEIEIENIQDRGQYFDKPEGAVGVLVQSSDEPAAFAAWYGNNHIGEWSLYGDQPESSQQIYYLSDSQTIFIGLF
ncbi:uncharacterized protein KGF55_004788 [Candida pseudojiufengensis]|uniref:uncharacterized protein n=1 Tax=Candida pseudojiufengensis TaxID=497109 RepID=UPI002225222E|nr:uncharacterized protein KGF55_004788 [Candida pseudojiufengensis]KAI5960065.1 hypothetical protein KGF55_004788 [Candida pseudojiufengensis]